MMSWITHVLAAGATPGDLFQSVLPWAVALIALAVVGALVIWAFRRLLYHGGSGASEGFTLQNLRDLRDQGELTEEEFQRAREAMIGRVAGARKPAPDGAKSDESSGAEGSSQEKPNAGPDTPGAPEERAE